MEYDISLDIGNSSCQYIDENPDVNIRLTFNIRNNVLLNE